MNQGAYAAAVAMGAWILLGLGVELISIRFRGDTITAPRSSVLSIGSIALFAVVPVGVVLAVSASRREFVGLFVEMPFGTHHHLELVLDQVRIPFLGSLLALSLALVLVAAAHVWRRSPGASLARAGLLVATVVSLIVATYCYRIAAAHEAGELRWPETLDAGAEILGCGRLVVLIVGGLIACLGPSWVPARRVPASRRAWLASALVLTIGVVAFAATRGFAHDTQLPLVRRLAAERISDRAAAAQLPLMYGCHPPSRLESIWIDVDPSVASITFPGYPSSSEVFDKNLGAEDALIRLLRNHIERTPQLWERAISGDRHRAWGHAVRMSLHMDTPMDTVREWLWAVYSVYGSDVQIVGRNAVSYETRTIGTVSNDVICSVNVELARDGRPFMDFDSVQSFAYAASASLRVYRLSPPRGRTGTEVMSY